MTTTEMGSNDMAKGGEGEFACALYSMADGEYW